MILGDDVLKGTFDFNCNLAQTLNIVGDKWTLLVLHRILNNINTFKELQETLKPIPTNILSDRIKLLEQNGFVAAKLYNEHPPRYQYVLTEQGKDFSHIFNAIILWSSKYLNNCNKTVCHEACGNEVEIKYYCKECDDYVDDLVVKE